MAIKRVDETIEIFLSDDGVGFDVGSVRSATREGGFGLFNIQERLDCYGGKFEIVSIAGKGSKFKLTAPLKAEGVAADK